MLEFPDVDLSESIVDAYVMVTDARISDIDDVEQSLALDALSERVIGVAIKQHKPGRFARYF